MNKDVCFLVTFLNAAVNDLVQCAVKVDRKYLPGDAGVYPREYEGEILRFVPEHVRSIGPVVGIGVIFEVRDCTFDLSWARGS